MRYFSDGCLVSTNDIINGWKNISSKLVSHVIKGQKVTFCLKKWIHGFFCLHADITCSSLSQKDIRRIQANNPRWPFHLYMFNLFCPESTSFRGRCSLAATVSSCIRLPTEQILHFLKAQVGHRDFRRALLLEASLEVEGHQEVLADQQCSPEARHAAQVLQVAPQKNGALALLSTVAVHGQHVDVHGGGVWNVSSHGLLKERDYTWWLLKSKQNEGDWALFMYLRKPFLVPAWADDERNQLSLFKPTQGQLWTQTQEVQHFIQRERTRAGHRNKSWTTFRQGSLSRQQISQSNTKILLHRNFKCKYLRCDTWAVIKFKLNIWESQLSCLWITKKGNLLAFFLDFKHADGVLRCEVPELAGRERVASLVQRADHSDWCLQEEGLQERRAADLCCHHTSKQWMGALGCFSRPLDDAGSSCGSLRSACSPTQMRLLFSPPHLLLFCLIP